MVTSHRCIAFLALGGLLASTTVAQAQFVLGTDYDSAAQFADPDNWTRTIIDGTVNGTVTFDLNPCEYVLYFDSDGNPSSCLGQPVACSTLTEMEATLTDAIAEWDDLANDALTLQYGDLVGGSCVVGGSCPAADAWADDDDWVVTRTYNYGTTLPAGDCPDAATASQTGGAGLKFFTDPETDHTTRWVEECDIVFFETKWDNTEDECLDEKSLTECAAAWQMALTHEIGHCLGFGHSYLTRHSLDPLDNANEIPDLVAGRASIMSYDREGNIDAASNGFGPYDLDVYLETYASSPDPNDDYFTASGEVKADCGGDDKLLFGAAVVALEVSGNDLIPVHMSISGIDPLDDGDFEIPFLSRSVSQYKLVVVDARDPNQLDPRGYGFDDEPGSIPGRNVFQTDDWDEDHAGPAYKYESRAQFDTGFDWKLTSAFNSPASGDHDAGTICVDWN